MQYECQRPKQNYNNDEEVLKKLIHEWAMCTVHRNTQDLEKIMADTFKISVGALVDGRQFKKTIDKKELLGAIQSGDMSVDWTCPDETMKVKRNRKYTEVSGK